MYSVKNNTDGPLSFKVRGGTKEEPKYDHVPAKSTKDIALANRNSRYVASLEATSAIVIAEAKPSKPAVPAKTEK